MKPLKRLISEKRLMYISFDNIDGFVLQTAQSLVGLETE